MPLNRRAFVLALVGIPVTVGAVEAVALEVPQLYRFTFAIPVGLPTDKVMAFLQWARTELQAELWHSPDGMCVFYEHNRDGHLTNRQLFQLEKECTESGAKKTWEELRTGLTWEMPDAT